MTQTGWERYPDHYRDAEIRRIVSAVRAGDSVALLGLSGAGKSNLLGYLSARIAFPPRWCLVDCNRLGGGSPDDLARLIGKSLTDQPQTGASFDDLHRMLKAELEGPGAAICLILDRFDALPIEYLQYACGNLRALRDEFKYRLTYLIGSRTALPVQTELSELFQGHTYWLGPLADQDAEWSIRDYAERHALAWDTGTVNEIKVISRNYPSLLRALCQIKGRGSLTDALSLAGDPLIMRTASEILAEHPTGEILAASGLEGHPLLSSKGMFYPLEADDLTISEHRLWVYFQEHPGLICSKDELVKAVWPEEKFIEGIRDDSLAQLVHRLRTKIEPDPVHPARIRTLPGRGYRYSPAADEESR